MLRMGMAFESNDNVGAGIDFSDPNSALANYYLRLGDVLFVAIVSVLFIVLNFTKLWHTDIWGHVQHGELWLQTHRFPNSDPFSFLADPNGGSINYAWISQVLFAGTFRLGAWLIDGTEIQRLAGGADALRFLLAVLVVLRLTLLFLAFRRISQSSIIGLIGVVFILGVSVGNLAVLRPQVISEALFSGLIFLVTRPTLGWFSVIGLSALLTFWANAHASFPIGCAAISAMWAGRFLQVFFGPPPRVFMTVHDQRLRQLTAVLILSLIGITFLNPEGWRIWQKTVAMANHPNVRAMDEWQPLFAPMAVGARNSYLFCLLFVVVALLAHRNWPTPEFFTLMAAFALPPLMTQRAVVWLVTVAPWVSMPLLGSWLARVRPTWWHSIPNFRRTILAGAIMLIALMWSIPGRYLIDGKPLELTRSLSDGTPWEFALATADPTLTPNTALVQVLKDYPDGRFQGSIFTSETLGDFFLWPLKPPVPIYIYSHVHLFSPEHWRRYTDVRDARSNWKHELDRVGVNLIVVYAEPRSKLSDEIKRDPAWKVVLDEAGNPNKIDPRCRLFAAMRVKPLLPKVKDVKQ